MLDLITSRELTTRITGRTILKYALRLCINIGFVLAAAPDVHNRAACPSIQQGAHLAIVLSLAYWFNWEGYILKVLTAQAGKVQSALNAANASGMLFRIAWAITPLWARLMRADEAGTVTRRRMLSTKNFIVERVKSKNGNGLRLGAVGSSSVNRGFLGGGRLREAGRWG